MPPKVKVTKEDIIAAAIELVRESGIDAVNARAIAKKLDCSTQPIFSNYASMEDLKAEVMLAANEIYQQYIEQGMKDPAYPPYKASGMSYIRFAKEENQLFKLLFMRDRSNEEIKEERESLEGLLQIIAANTGLSMDEAYMFHLEMWIFVHGIATMIATEYLEWEWDMISRMMTDSYEGMKARFMVREEK